MSAGKLIAKCHDCSRPYGKPGFPDLVIPNAEWAKISPSGDENGLLCPSCICARLERAGIETVGVFRSGPLFQADDAALKGAEIERLQRIIDSRPAINAGLPETYIRWSQSIYVMEANHSAGVKPS